MIMIIILINNVNKLIDNIKEYIFWKRDKT